MIISEKLWFIKYIKTIRTITKWDLFIIRYIKQFLQDSDPEILRHHDELLEIVLKLISNRPIIDYVKITNPQINYLEFHEILRDLINIYLMRQEDINRLI